MAQETPRQDNRPPRQEQQQGRPRDDRRQERRPPRLPQDRNTVFIGNKPPMNYVLAVVTQFNSGSNDVLIRARGQAISQAVDVAEIVRNKFFQKAAVTDVKIATEVVTSEDGRRRHVSAIAITLHNTDAGAAPASAKPPLPGQEKPTAPPAEPPTPQKSGAV